MTRWAAADDHTDPAEYVPGLSPLFGAPADHTTREPGEPGSGCASSWAYTRGRPLPRDLRLGRFSGRVLAYLLRASGTVSAQTAWLQSGRDVPFEEGRGVVLEGLDPLAASLAQGVTDRGNPAAAKVSQIECGDVVSVLKPLIRDRPRADCRLPQLQRRRGGRHIVGGR